MPDLETLDGDNHERLDRIAGRIDELRDSLDEQCGIALEARAESIAWAMQCTEMGGRIAALETTIAEQRRVGRALAARVRLEGGYASTDDQVALREADQLFGVEHAAERATR